MTFPLVSEIQIYNSPFETEAGNPNQWPDAKKHAIFSLIHPLIEELPESFICHQMLFYWYMNYDWYFFPTKLNCLTKNANRFLEMGGLQQRAMRFMALTVIETHPLLLNKMQSNCFYFPTLNNSEILTLMTQDLIKKPQLLLKIITFFADVADGATSTTKR